MCSVKKPKVSNPAQAQIAAPIKVNPLRLGTAARQSLRGQGVAPSSLRIPMNTGGQQ